MILPVFIIHYIIVLLQNRFLFFGAADVADYQHYFQDFSSISSVSGLTDFFSAHVPFYTMLYPGWLYSVFGADSFIIIRLINFSLVLFSVVPLNNILDRIFNVSLRPWQLLLIIFLPSTTRYSVMVGRDMVAAFLILLFISSFLDTIYRKSQRHILWFLFITLALLLTRIHNLILLVGVIISMLLLKSVNSKQKVRDHIILVPFVIIISVVSYQLFIMYGPSYHAITNVESLASVAQARAQGNTVYLEEYYPSTIFDMMWYAPLHGFYFLFSPMPWSIFSIETLVAFIESWTVLILITVAIVFGRDEIKNNRCLQLVVLIIVIFAVGFGVGVKNAGGAMRWRIPATILLFTLSTTVVDITWRNRTNEKSQLSHK